METMKKTRRIALNSWDLILERLKRKSTKEGPANLRRKWE